MVRRCGSKVRFKAEWFEVSVLVQFKIECLEVWAAGVPQSTPPHGGAENAPNELPETSFCDGFGS